MSEFASTTISADFPFQKKKVNVLGSYMSYVDVNDARGMTALFLHGNPTSSYLWRNIIPLVAGNTRCVAPDLIGFGDSGKIPTSSYRFSDHQQYLEAFIDVVLPTEKIVLVVHDWGSALGFDWARRHEERVAGLAFMEFILPGSWEELGDDFNHFIPPLRSPELGRKLLIDDNVFIEKMLPAGVARKLSEAEMTEYRRPFLQKEFREPIYRFPNELPVEGEPADVWETAQKYMAWLVDSDTPKLFFWAPEGVFIQGHRAKELLEQMHNIQSVRLESGKHYLQEDHPDIIGREIAGWLSRFVLHE
ncbi:putative Haloalkane dehalogenase [Xylogone sp. PMI_703]|nr:putative Haloalkane dehalogenase [Xylogone sp. PMI_703]